MFQRLKSFNFNTKPTLFKEVTRGYKTQLLNHYQYIRQYDFIQNHFTMFNPVALQTVMLD